MKKLYIIFFLLFGFTFSLFSQEDFETILNKYFELFKQGKYEEAIPYGEKLLKNYKDYAYGELDTTFALVVNHVGMNYYYAGKYEKAEPLFLRSLEIREKILGKDHPKVAISLGSLADLYQTQGKYEKAELLYLRALEIQEKVLGNDHPEVANSLNNLAALYQTQGKYEKAEPLLLRAL